MLFTRRPSVRRRETRQFAPSVDGLPARVMPTTLFAEIPCYFSEPVPIDSPNPTILPNDYVPTQPARLSAMYD